MNATSIQRCLRLLLIMNLFAPLMGCAPLRVLNTLVPESSFSVTRDIPFSTLSRNKLDVYKPISFAPTSAQKPAVVFFYGGAWDSGEKSS